MIICTAYLKQPCYLGIKEHVPCCRLCVAYRGCSKDKCTNNPAACGKSKGAKDIGKEEQRSNTEERIIKSETSYERY